MSSHPPASLGVALIARNAAQTLPSCLESIRPYCQQIVVGVDETTTDDTAAVAQRFGALTPTITVSEPHECPAHGRIMAQHFAKARQQSFGYLDKGLDWWMWLDSDDVVEHGEELGKVLASTPAEVTGFWLPYRYATMDDGRLTNTLFDRERLLRASVPWQWEYRVHEVVRPLVENPQWIRTEIVQIRHQEGVHKAESSAARNLTLLEIDLEESPNDARSIFYTGNQHFALGHWAEAAAWYERLAEVGQNPYELWQSFCYAAMAYERLGYLNDATRMAFNAIDVRPEHPEPYLRLASIYLLAGEAGKCVYWTREARTKRPPPHFVFKNPLDYNYNVRMPLADALAQLGYIGEARKELEAAQQIHAEPRVAEAVERYRGLEAAAAHATSAAHLMAGRPDAEVVRLWETLDLPPAVRQFGRVRDVVMPAYIRQRSVTCPRIVFLCGQGLEEWAPPVLNTSGIGGSETAVVEIARRFARDGWRADVYASPGRYEGEYETVGYWQWERWAGSQDHADVRVAWRHPEWVPASENVSLLWLHDLNYGPEAQPAIDEWAKRPAARILGVSQWHAQMLTRYYGAPAGYVPNGVDLSRFSGEVKRIPFRCVYASSPDRGLVRLLRLWPEIIAVEPTAELHVAYGWQNVDRMIAKGNGDLARFKAETIKLLERTPRVIWRGRLPQDELAKLHQESCCWLYPTDFLEVSCISAMEAMAGGAVPVTSAVGALPSTIANGGIVVPGSVYSRAWERFWLRVTLGVLTEPQVRRYWQEQGQSRVQALTWDEAYSQWLMVITHCVAERQSEVAA